MRIKIILCMLDVILCITIAGCQTDEEHKLINTLTATNEHIEDSEMYYTGNGSAWKSSLFESSSTTYSKDIALISTELCAKGNNGKDDILNLLSDYGLYAREAYNYGGDFDSAAHAIAQDSLYINGKDTAILVIVCRGTTTFFEGIGDWAKGGTDEFLNEYDVWDNSYDFEEEVWNSICRYIDKYPAIKTADKLKIFVTGHSLGGAAANMIGARFTDGIGKNEWWSSKLTQEDVYVYTLGAIKVLDSDRNIEKGFENIHNIYNKYDTFGPNGNFAALGVSSPYAKFGHTDLYDVKELDREVDSLSTENHNIPNYKDAINGDKIVCQNNNSYNEQERSNAVQDSYSVPISSSADFSIVGKWKNAGNTTFGQAQAGAIVIFDGEKCNYVSPGDTYAFYRDGNSWRLDCTTMLFADTLSFEVAIIDNDNIVISYGGNDVSLQRINSPENSMKERSSGESFIISGKWKNVGDTTFGQAQKGAIVNFDGTYCNFVSPSDTYAFYRNGDLWRLDCSTMLFAETLSFDVMVIDNDNIIVDYGDTNIHLARIN